MIRIRISATVVGDRYRLQLDIGFGDTIDLIPSGDLRIDVTASPDNSGRPAFKNEFNKILSPVY